MRQELVTFLYSIHEHDQYPVESCAEMLHGFKIIDANDLDEILKHGTLVDRKWALIRAISTKDDVMMLVWAKILEEMGFPVLATRARAKYNEVIEAEDQLQINASLESSRTDATSRQLSVFSDVPAPSPAVRRKRLQKELRLGDIPHHVGSYLDRDEEWDIRSAIVQLFHPGTNYPRPPNNKRPNRASRANNNGRQGSALPKIPQSQQVSVLRSGVDGSLNEARSKFPQIIDKSQSKPLLLVITGQRGIGKSTIVAHIVSDDVFLQKFCSVGTVIWLNAARIADEETFFQEIADKIFFSHPKDSRLKLRDILPSVIANLRQSVLLVVDDANNDSLAWFSMFGSGKTLRCVFIFKGEMEDSHVMDQTGQLARESIIVEHVGRAAYDDVAWLISSHWKSDLAHPPGITRDSFGHLADACHGLPLVSSLVVSLLDGSTSQEQTDAVLDCLGDKNGQGVYATISSLVSLAFAKESQEFRDRFYWMLLFGQGQPIAVDDLALVWNCARSRAKLFCVDFVDKGLVVSASPQPNAKTIVNNKLPDNSCAYVVNRAIYDAVVQHLRAKNNGESLAGFVTRQLLSPEFHYNKLQQSRPGENFFHLCCRISNIRLFKLIAELIYEDIDTLASLCREQERNQSLTPLHSLFELCTQESWELLSLIAERLVGTDVSVGIKDKRGRSITDLAISELQTKRVGSGQTLLMLAARQMCHRFVAQLVAASIVYEDGIARADFLNAKDDYGRTVLHQQSAEEGGSVEMVRLLLDHQADVEAVDNKRRTSLHYVARFGCGDVCSELMARKCNLHAVDDCGKTPLALARIARHYGIIRLLEGYEVEFERIKGIDMGIYSPPPPRAHSAGVGEYDAFMQDASQQTMPTTTLPGLRDDAANQKQQQEVEEGSFDGDYDYDEEDAMSGETSNAGTLTGTNTTSITAGGRGYPNKGGRRRRGRSGSRRGSGGRAGRSRRGVKGGSADAALEGASRANKRHQQGRGSDGVAKHHRRLGRIHVDGIEEEEKENGSIIETDRSPGRGMRRHNSKGHRGGTDEEQDENSPERSHARAHAGSHAGHRHHHHQHRGRDDNQSNSNFVDDGISPRQRTKTKTMESMRLRQASKIKLCIRRGDFPEQIVYFERREEEEKLRDALREMCFGNKHGLIVVTGEKGAGASTMVGEVMQQDEFIRDVCLVDMILWYKAGRGEAWSNDPSYEFEEEVLLRALARLLQIREPSATNAASKEQKRGMLERKLRDTLADRLRPMILVIENVTNRDHGILASCVQRLNCPLLKVILISRPYPPSSSLANFGSTTLLPGTSMKQLSSDEDLALLSSFGDHMGSVHGCIRVKQLSRGRLGGLFTAYWSRPFGSIVSPLDRILATTPNISLAGGLLELPTIEELAEIYVGRPSLVANILYIALKSCYFEQDIQESFYSFVEMMRTRVMPRPPAADPTMPPKLTQSEASILQVLKFVLEKEPKDFKRKYYSFLLFDESDTTLPNSGLGGPSQAAGDNVSMKTGGGHMNEEVAVAIVWNPFRNKYDNDLLLRALRRLGMTRHVGKFHYEVVLLVMPNSLLAQLNKPDLEMSVKAMKLLMSLVSFRQWFLVNSLTPETVCNNQIVLTARDSHSGRQQTIATAPPLSLHRQQSRAQTTWEPPHEVLDNTAPRFGHYSAAPPETSSLALARSKWSQRGKKRVVVCCLKPKRVSTSGRLTNRSQMSATLDTISQSQSVTTSQISKRRMLLNAYGSMPSKKPSPHVLLEGGRLPHTNPLVAVLYYFDKVMHSH